MKKYILILFLLLFSNTSFSQNMIGESWSDVMKMVKENGLIIDYGETEGNIRYISGMDKGRVRIYYFTDNNLCFSYGLIVDNGTYEIYRRSLIENGYVSLGNRFYKDKFVADIVWVKEEEMYVLILNSKNVKAPYTNIY